tara:strand:- start:7 stop:729 length:723 start_codon:yes stop_codon:yes gene_type:complete
MANQSWYNSFFDNAPYNDSWKPSKNYLCVGFLPGYALQSRELLELQTSILYQTSTTNRTLFKHGQPRIDLEEENFTPNSPITVNNTTSTFTIKENTQLFTNFSLGVTSILSTIPNGFWITIPPSELQAGGIQAPTHVEMLDSTPQDNQYVGFNVEIKTINSTDDETLFDPAGTEFRNNNAPGATRYAYSIVYNISEDPTSGFLKTNKNKRNQGEFFVPIAQYKNGSYYWAFDENTSIQGT